MHRQPSHNDRLRRLASRLIEVSKTKTGTVYFGPGMALVAPVKPALERLVDLHKQAVGQKAKSDRVRKLPAWGARILHRRETVSILGTMTGAQPDHRRDLMHAIISFANENRSVEGVEALVFSAVVGAESDEPKLAEGGRHLLKTIEVPQFLGGGYSQTPVVDPVAKQITFLTPAQVVGFVGGGGFSGNVPQVGGAVPGWAGDPSGNVEDADTCTKVVTIVATVLGVVGGGGLGGVAGAAVPGKSGMWIGIGGGGITGGLSGAQGGDILAKNVICSNNASASPSGTAQGKQVDVDAIPDYSPPSPQDQSDYSNGFAAGWAAASGASSGAPPAGGSPSFGSGYADGYGASAAMQTLPAGGGAPTDPGSGSGPSDPGSGSGPSDPGSGSGPTDPGSGSGPSDPGSGSGPTDPGSGSGPTDPGSGSGPTDPGSGSGGGMANPEGGGDEGLAVPGAGTIIHHLSPTGPGLTDDGDRGEGRLSSIGSKVLQLAPLPDPENNPRAMSGLQEATSAQAALLVQTVASRLRAASAVGEQ
jgi:hypothetical protein